MFYKFLPVILVLALLHSSVAAQSLAQPPESIQRVLRSAQDKDKSVKVTSTTSGGGRATVQGKVTEISQTTFTVVERQSGKPITFAYADVLQVKRSGMSKGAKVGIGVGVAVAALIMVAVLVTKPWRSE